MLLGGILFSCGVKISLIFGIEEGSQTCLVLAWSKETNQTDRHMLTVRALQRLVGSKQVPNYRIAPDPSRNFGFILCPDEDKAERLRTMSGLVMTRSFLILFPALLTCLISMMSTSIQECPRWFEMKLWIAGTTALQTLMPYLVVLYLVVQTMIFCNMNDLLLHFLNY